MKPLILDTGAGCTAVFTWSEGRVEIRFRNPYGQETRRVRGPWRRESIARCDAQVREAVLSAVRTGRCPAWSTGFASLRDAGHKPSITEGARS